jgi:hypothetical protein
MDTAAMVGALLLVAGLGTLLHHEPLARVIGAEIPLQDVGVDRREEAYVWAGIVAVAGLALALTGALRLVT